MRKPPDFDVSANPAARLRSLQRGGVKPHQPRPLRGPHPPAHERHGTATRALDMPGSHTTCKASNCKESYKKKYTLADDFDGPLLVFRSTRTHVSHAALTKEKLAAANKGEGGTEGPSLDGRAPPKRAVLLVACTERI